MLQNKRYYGNLIKGGKMNYLIGFIIFVGGLSILIAPALVSAHDPFYLFVTADLDNCVLVAT